MTGALLRYRILAWVTGIGLIILVFVGVPLQVFADQPSVASVVGTAHGFLYMVYLLTVLDLAVRLRWNLVRVVAVMLAGTIPLLGLYVEHRLTPKVRARIVERQTAAPATAGSSTS